MKLVRFYSPGSTSARWGVVAGEEVQPLDFSGDFAAFMAAGQPLAAAGRRLPLAEVVLASPAGRPGKIMAIGLNYRDHAREGKAEVPAEPLVFAKFPSSVVGSGAEIRWDARVTRKVDFEAELAVVVGRRVHRCSPDEAREAIYGYTCANDVSARDLQFGDGQWVRGKSLDTFCPLGPWLVTRDELPCPQELAISCRVNGRLMQESNTERMIFPVAYLVYYLARHFTLFPGDVILTGTPAGVGVFRQPAVYLQDGDLVEVKIAGIGRLVNRCRVE